MNKKKEICKEENKVFEMLDNLIESAKKSNLNIDHMLDYRKKIHLEYERIKRKDVSKKKIYLILKQLEKSTITFITEQNSRLMICKS